MYTRRQAMWGTANGEKRRSRVRQGRDGNDDATLVYRDYCLSPLRLILSVPSTYFEGQYLTKICLMTATYPPSIVNISPDT